jgi:tetratricopeptide (TPR) repeat protein
MTDYVRALDTLAGPKGNSDGDSVSAELTVAESMLSIGNLGEAERSARRALKLLEAAGEGERRRSGAKVLRTLAKVLSGKKEWREEAQRRYNEALELAVSSGDGYEAALAHNGLGLLAWRVADHQTALRHHQMALKEIEGLPTVSKADRIRVLGAKMRIHMGLGNVYLDLIDMGSAIEHDLKAIEIGKSMESWVDVGLVYNNLARVYEEMRNYQDAVDNYEKGIEYLHRGKGAKMEGWTMTNLASTLVEMGRAKEARPHLEKAEKLLKDFGDPIAHSKLNCMWGKYHRARREWSPGIERFKRSVSVIEHENTPDYLATAQEEFGTLYQEMGDSERARDLLSSALDWQRKKGDTYRAEKIETQLAKLKA